MMVMRGAGAVPRGRRLLSPLCLCRFRRWLLPIAMLLLVLLHQQLLQLLQLLPCLLRAALGTNGTERR